MSGMGDREGGVGILDDEVRTEVRTPSRVRTVHHPASDAGVSPMVSGELWPSCRQSLPGRRPDSDTQAARYKDIQRSELNLRQSNVDLTLSGT